ncbi:MaoC family dehydratase [Aquirhabdus sp.]|uniref:MaoC family dehydratase n=1 Tax=Aquirhabdus sp. TaxID=2824160 RepID=UPI00396CC9E8
MSINYQTIQVGDTLPPLQLSPITRTTLALFAGASGDHNPIHIDSDFAKQAGTPDVFAHGMLSMAWLGRLLIQWVPQRQIVQFNARFAGITHLGDTPLCTGKVIEKLESDGQQLLKIELHVTNQSNEIKILGDALIKI